MKISVTNIKTKENIEVRCNNVVYKATEKLTKGAFSVIPLKVYEKTDKEKSVPELFAYLDKYGYKF